MYIIICHHTYTFSVLHYSSRQASPFLAKKVARFLPSACREKRNHSTSLCNPIGCFTFHCGRPMQSVANRFALALFLCLGQRVAQLYGVPGAIRTLDPLLRRQLLCPTELQGHFLLSKCSTRGREGQGSDFFCAATPSRY